MPNGPAKTAKQSRGTACVLLLVDSRYAEHAQLPETMYAALGHFGIPYRVVDLARRDLDASLLARCAAVVIGQENIGLGLTAAAQRRLLEAVQGGLGLVNFDYNLSHYDAGYCQALGLTGAGAGGRFATGGVASVGIRDNDHYLTYTQDSGAQHTLRSPIPGIRARITPGDAVVLAEADQGQPAVVASSLGAGRIVQWLVSPRLWMLQYFGHAHGLDDLFWKGIVWTVRKPFAMLSMPPFVRLRFDDCNGLWQSPDDFAFVKLLNEYGHKPNMCVCMQAVTPESWSLLKRLQDEDKVEVAPHTWKGGVSLYYGDADGEYSEDRFRTLIRETKAILDRHGIAPSKILSDHDHEFSARVLPYLGELGIAYKMNVMMPGETWSGMHRDWRPLPYGSMSYALDYTPGPYPLFVVFNHHPAFDFARSYIAPNRFLLNRSGGYGEHMWDFMNGLTEQSIGRNDIEQMARRLADHTRLGLNSLFFGGSISHSHFTRWLSLAEWHALMRRYDSLTERFEKINVGYDDIADYARARFHTRLAQADAKGPAGELSVKLTGTAERPLRLSIFQEKGGAIERSFEEIECAG